MRSFIGVLSVALLVTATIAGCGGSASASTQLLGDWEIDVDGMKEMEEFKKASEMEQKMMVGMLEGMDLTVTFTESEMKSSMSMMGKTKEDSQPYSIRSENGRSLVIVGKRQDGTEEAINVTIRGKKMTVVSGNDKFALKRKGN